MRLEADGELVIYGAGYLIWLLAGLADFQCHRRSDLPHTSGLRESVFHLAQLSLLGIAVLLLLIFEGSATLAVMLTALVATHAIVGYLDTRQAYGRRAIVPVEQHLHSVLDMAPMFALSIFIAQAWPAAAGGGLMIRRPSLSLWIWAFALVPAALMCVMPALFELRDAAKAYRQRKAA